MVGERHKIKAAAHKFSRSTIGKRSRGSAVNFAWPRKWKNGLSQQKRRYVRETSMAHHKSRPAHDDPDSGGGKPRKRRCVGESPTRGRQRDRKRPSANGMRMTER